MRNALKPLIFSFIITTIYFCISALYFFGNYYDLQSGGIRRIINLILTYPANMYFGYGYSGHTLLDIFIMELKIFAPIWGVLFLILKD